MASSAAVAAPAEAAPKKSKLPLIIILVVVLLAAGGAGAWFFMAKNAEADDEEPKAASKPPVFLPVDQFTVNLQQEDGQQFLQAAMTLRVVDQAVVDQIKAVMPEVRSRVLLLLSSKKPSQLATQEGKVNLAKEIASEVEASLPEVKKANSKKKKAKEEEPVKKSAKKDKGKKAKAKEEEAEEPDAPTRVLAVLFTHFIVQ
jgi:flagellar FliL protein